MNALRDSTRNRFLAPILGGILVASTVLGMVFLIDVRFRDLSADMLRESTAASLGARVAEIRGIFSDQFAAIDRVSRFVVANPDYSEHDFSLVAQAAGAGSNPNRWVLAAPGGTVRGGYPASYSARLIGKSVPGAPNISAAARRDLQARKLVIVNASSAWPDVDLVAIYSLYLPVDSPESGERFWGHVLAGIDLDKLFSKTELPDSGLNLDLGIRLFGSSAEELLFEWGNVSLFDAQSVVQTLSLPVGRVELAAVPKGGWESPDRNRLLLWGIGVFAATLAGWLIFLLITWRERIRFVRNHLEDLVEEGTKETRRQESFLRTILNHTDNGLIVLNRDGRVVFYNQLYMDIWGFSPADLEGQPRLSRLIRRAAESGLYSTNEIGQLVQSRLSEVKNIGPEKVVQLSRLDGRVIESYSVEMPDGGYLVSYRDTTSRLIAENELKESKQRYEHLFQSAEVGIMEVDFSKTNDELSKLRAQNIPDLSLYLHEHLDVMWSLIRSMIVRGANGAAMRLFGAPDITLLQAHSGRFIPDDSISVFVDLIAAISSEKPFFRAETNLRRIDGNEIVVIISLPIPKNSVTLRRTPISILDITKRKRSELALRELAQVSSSILGERFYDQLVVALANLLDASHVLLAINIENRSECMRTLSYYNEGLIEDGIEFSLKGSPAKALLDGRVSICPENVRQAYPDAKLLNELEIDGFMGTPLFDSTGQVMGGLMVMDRKPMRNRRGSMGLLSIFAERAAAELQLQRGQAALKESEELFRGLFESAAVGMAQFDLRGHFLRVNRSYAKIFGRSVKELRKLNVEQITHPDDREESVRRQKKLMAGKYGGDSYSIKKRYIHKNGSTINANVTLALVRDVRGEPAYIIAEVQDLTERLQSDAEREQLGLQLRQAQKMESIGHLTGGIAHDFNNILAAILGYAVLAQERFGGDMDEVLSRYIQEIVRAGERARDLIAQMLAFSRGMEGEAEPVNIEPVVKEVAKLLQSTLPSTLQIRYELDPDLPQIKIDMVQFHQVMMNLCVNARDATNGRGDLTIRIRRVVLGSKRYCVSCHKRFVGDYVVLSVADDGTGIDPEITDRIFDPFFTTKDVGRGTGMGLSVVHGIAHQNSGHIEIESTRGEGTVLSVFFPVWSGDKAEDEARILPPMRSKVSGRVLVVDDELVIVNFMRELLEMHECEVVGCTSSVDALRRFESEYDAFDLVITDQTMPEMTGIELSRELLAIREDIPIILCSGFNQDVAEIEVQKHNLGRFLMKPIDTDELLGCIHELLEPDSSRVR